MGREARRVKLKYIHGTRTSFYAEESGLEETLEAIYKRFTYRMQDLGEFMKGLLQRFTQWFNRAHAAGSVISRMAR